MQQAIAEDRNLGQLRKRLDGKTHVLIVLCMLLLAGAALVPSNMFALALFLAGAILAATTLVLRAARLREVRFDQAERDFLSSLLEGDPTPAFVTLNDGEIRFRNDAAIQGLGNVEKPTIEQILAEPVGAEVAQMLVARLSQRALAQGAAREDVTTTAGHLRIGAQSLDGGHMLWRLEDFTAASADEEFEHQVPLISIGRSRSILFMNAAARKLAGGRPKLVEDLFCNPEEIAGGVARLITPRGEVRRHVFEVARSGARRELLLLPLETMLQPASEPLLPVHLEDIWDMADELPIPILRLSVSGEIETANSAARHLLSLEPGARAELSALMEGLGRSIRDWLAEAAESPAEPGAKPHSEFLRLSRSEREVYVQVAVKPVLYDGRRALIAVLSDATELKTLEAQFVQSQKMQAIGQLAGGVAHDFNNLLTAISGHCDLLLLRHDHGDPEFGDLIQINQNANRAAALVGQLLAFSRKQTLRPETVDLRNTLSDLTHLLNRLVGEKVTLALTHEPGLPKIRADKRQLEQVLMNLIVNARDALPEGGEIRVTTEMLHLDEEMNRDRAVLAPGEYVLVKVIDTGVGIPPDKLQKVFEPFFTTKRVGEGTGLGLSTAYGIVKQSGGFIFVESTPGQGTCFSLLFPAQRDEPALAAAAPPVLEEPDTSRGEGVVLLVEDEAPVRAFAGRALRLRGYTVLEAEHAEEALEILETTKLKIDVFVTDVVMPGMDGPTWVRKALPQHPDVRVVFVSGYAEDSFSETSTPIPNSVFLPKPFSLAELTETVRLQLQ